MYNNSTTPTETDYLGGFQYKKEPNQAVRLQFFPTAEGYVNAVYSEITPTEPPKYQYVYNYTDHLGNIRVSYTKDPSNAGTLKILEENHYYPFGLKINYFGLNKSALTLDTSQNKILIPTNVNGYKYKYNGKEYQDELGLNFYDYGNRNYDATIGRFHNMDRFSEKYVDTSPYHYTKNNPIFFVDIKGDSLAVFKPDGSFWRIEDDGKKEWSGRFYQKSKVTGVKVDGNTTTTYYEYSGALDFEFADPENDSKAIKDGVITSLVVVSEDKIAEMLGNAGAFDPANRENEYDYMNKESKGGGKLDFSYSSIPKNFSGASGDPLNTPSPMLFLPKGEKLAHNHMNFGNFLWAAAGNSLGFSKGSLRLAAHYNSVANSETNGYKPQLDSNDDQRSISAGSDYSSANQFNNRTWSPDKGISPKPKR